MVRMFTEAILFQVGGANKKGSMSSIHPFSCWTMYWSANLKHTCVIKGVCPITANMVADVNRRGTVSAAPVMEPDTPEPLVIHVSIFCYLCWFVVFDPSNWSKATDRRIEVCRLFRALILLWSERKHSDMKSIQTRRTKWERPEKPKWVFKDSNVWKATATPLWERQCSPLAETVWEKTHKATNGTFWASEWLLIWFR